MFALNLASLLILLLVTSCWCEEFLWGTATAAYQIEGASRTDGRSACIWDTFCDLPGRIAHGDNGMIAADAYHHLEEDVALMKQMGMNSYRFSLSWSRIMPDGRGTTNPLGIAHYSHLIDLLLAADIQPLVTLYHWDLPQALEDEYSGWLSAADIERDFVAYADACFTAFGDRVKLWTTINEPWTFSLLGYGSGDFAPGRCSNRTKCAHGDTSTETYVVGHNALNAHAAVVELYHTRYQPTQGGKIGIVLNLDFAEPADPQSVSDVAAAQRMNEFTLGWFADPIFLGSGYPASMRDRAGARLPEFTAAQAARLKGSADFLGFNSYSMKYVKSMPVDMSSGQGWLADQRSTTLMRDKAGALAGEMAASPWLVVAPTAFQSAISWVVRRYHTPPMYITENGVDVPGENHLLLPQALRDPFRISYYAQYLEQMREAMAAGADIRGYFAWSLLDNFEWKDGYMFRFGLHYVDYSTKERTRYAKDSAMWYRNYVEKAKRAELGGRAAGAACGRRGQMTSWWDYLSNAILRTPFSRVPAPLN